MSGFDDATLTPVGTFDPALRAEAAIRQEAERLNMFDSYQGEMTADANGGYVQPLEIGSIYYHERPEHLLRACYVEGGVDLKYRALGGPGSWLGYPVTSSEHTADGRVWFNRFEHGRIYRVGGDMLDGSRAYAIRGDIRRRWTELGEAAALGYPTTDELTTPDGIGRYTHFESGSIYWTPDTGAWEVRGKIRDQWASLGWERSYLGYPVAGEVTKENGDRATGFQRGEIRWYAATDAPFDYPASVQLSTILTTDTSVGGSATWTMTSKGDWHWTGHLHNSGFVGFDVVAAVRLNFVDAAGTGYATATNDGHVDGTSSTGDDTTFSWDQFGNAAVIRDNWDKGVAANGITTRVEVDATVGDVLSILFTGVIIVGSVLFAFGGDDNGVQACPGHRTSDGQQTPGSVVIYKKGELPPPCADDF